MEKKQPYFILLLLLICSRFLAAQPIDIRLITEKIILGNNPNVELLAVTDSIAWPAIKNAEGWENADAYLDSKKPYQKLWFRCTLYNSDSIERSIGFYNNWAHYTKLNVSSKGKETMVASGKFTPAKSLQFMHDGNYNSFAIEAGETAELYGYLKFSSAMQDAYKFSLYDIGYYHRVLAGKMIDKWGTSQYHSFTIGALAFAALFVGLIGIWFKK